MSHDPANRGGPALLLDEMHAPAVAQALRNKGYDVLAVAEESALRAMTDEELFQWAASQDRCIVTENVKDFRPILVATEEAGGMVAHLLFTSSRVFPRSRRNPGLLIEALDSWLRSAQHAEPMAEQWLARSR